MTSNENYGNNKNNKSSFDITEEKFQPLSPWQQINVLFKKLNKAFQEMEKEKEAEAKKTKDKDGRKDIDDPSRSPTKCMTQKCLRKSPSLVFKKLFLKTYVLKF